MKTEFLLYFIW